MPLVFVEFLEPKGRAPTPDAAFVPQMYASGLLKMRTNSRVHNDNVPE